MRKKLIAGNWKMNKDINETTSFINDLIEQLKDFKNEVDIVICPPFTSLVTAKFLLKNSPIKLGAQNMSQHDNGAYTGEISARMLAAIGCDYVILGHSERRQYFKESDELVNAKIKQALKYEIKPIVCVGETLEERESGATDKIITSQIKGVFHELTSTEVAKTVVAYEPVWAIGTGKNASPDQANQVHCLIRKLISQLYSMSVAETLSILYGGSVNSANANDLLSKPDIDGALVGGASLQTVTFYSIIKGATEAL